MPQLGLGVLRVPSKEVIAPIKSALSVGYRHLDTAAVYGNEEGVGTAIRESNVAREDIFLTTKVWNTDLGYSNALRAFDRSVERLGVDYVDLYLIHWPTTNAGKIVETWQALCELRDAGRARSIGVSNFTVEHLNQLARHSDTTPVVNQIELHPWFQQKQLREYHAEHGIRTEAWSPLGQGQVLEDPVIAEIARSRGRSPAQVILRWHLDLGHIVIPKSITPSRITQNLNVFDFSLDEAELARIAELDRGHRIGSHPDKPPTSRLPYDD
jgi:2,5-diketo-D-gluconate reductase A